MAKSRATREAEFRAEHGVSSGTYYEMRQKATQAGISGKTFDRVYQRAGYAEAKGIAQLARSDRKRDDKGGIVYNRDRIEQARYNAAIHAGLITSDVALSDFDDSLDFADIPDDFDWYYH